MSKLFSFKEGQLRMGSIFSDHVMLLFFFCVGLCLILFMMCVADSLFLLIPFFFFFFFSFHLRAPRGSEPHVALLVRYFYISC